MIDYISFMKVCKKWQKIKSGSFFPCYYFLEKCLPSVLQSTIEMINNKAMHNLINVKYSKMAFRSARWCCSREFMGTPWSNKSDAQPPEGDNPQNLLFSRRIVLCLKVSQSQNEILVSSNLPKMTTKFQTDFCPMKLGQKSVKYLVGFLGDLKTPKFHSEIN